MTRSQSGSLANPFTYTSREANDAGMMYYRARYYNPGIGRFVSEDLLLSQQSNSAGQNFYSYGDNDSISKRDPFGLIGIGGSPGEITKKRIEEAIKTLRRELEPHCCGKCSAYFANQQNIELLHLCDWLRDGSPPYVYVIERGRNQRGFGAAQQREPFLSIFIFEDSFQKPEMRLPCDLALLILHEAGHLVRKDTGDYEPQDFFDACKVGCLIPGKYH